MSVSRQDGGLQISGQRVISLEQAAQSDGCARILEYWRSHASSVDGVPRRKDIDPLDLADFLPYLGILDVIGECEPYEFRIRLQGTALVEAIGEFTGSTISQTPLAARSLGHFQDVVRLREPICAEGDLWFFGKDHVCYRELCLPLANGNGEVDKVMLFVELCGLQDARASDDAAGGRLSPLYPRQ